MARRRRRHSNGGYKSTTEDVVLVTIGLVLSIAGAAVFIITHFN